MKLISDDGLVYLDESGRELVIQRMRDEKLLQAVTYRSWQLQAVTEAERAGVFTPPHTLNEWTAELREALRALTGELAVRSPGGDPRRARPIDVPGGIGEQLTRLEADLDSAQRKVRRMQDALRNVRATGGISATARRMIDAAIADRRCAHGTYRWTGQVCRECEAREDAERGA